MAENESIIDGQIISRIGKLDPEVVVFVRQSGQFFSKRSDVATLCIAILVEAGYDDRIRLLVAV